MGSIFLGVLTSRWGTTWSMGVILRSRPFSDKNVESADIWGTFIDIFHLLDDVFLET